MTVTSPTVLLALRAIGEVAHQIGKVRVIAIPISYWGIAIYLKDFAYKANISSWLFIVAAIIISLISILTLVYQVKKAARQNPAEVIKSE